MTQVHCAGGYTQIGKVLSHARAEAAKRRVSALVYVGDCMEEEIDDLCGRAGELALLGVPVFLFQEGTDARAEQGLPRDRAPDQGRLLPLRCGIGGAAARAALRRRRLRRGRAQGAAGADRARCARAAAAAEIGRPRASHAIPAAGLRRAGAVPDRHSRLHDGQPAGAGAAVARRRRRRRAGGSGLPRVSRAGRLRHLAGDAGLVAAVGARRHSRLSGPCPAIARPDLARDDRASGGGARPRQRRHQRPRAEGLLRGTAAGGPQARRAGASVAGLPLRRSAVGADRRGLSRPPAPELARGHGPRGGRSMAPAPRAA